jgi:hypothetical protein
MQVQDSKHVLTGVAGQWCSLDQLPSYIHSEYALPSRVNQAPLAKESVNISGYRVPNQIPPPYVVQVWIDWSPAFDAGIIYLLDGPIETV